LAVYVRPPATDSTRTERLTLFKPVIFRSPFGDANAFAHSG